MADGKRKNETGPSCSNRSQLSAYAPTSNSTKKVVRRLKPRKGQAVHFPFSVTFTVGEESAQAPRRADNVSDESISSTHIAESAVLNGIGKMPKIIAVP